MCTKLNSSSVYRAGIDRTMQSSAIVPAHFLEPLSLCEREDIWLLGSSVLGGANKLEYMRADGLH